MHSKVTGKQNFNYVCILNMRSLYICIYTYITSLITAITFNRYCRQQINQAMNTLLTLRGKLCTSQICIYVYKKELVISFFPRCFLDNHFCVYCSHVLI